MVLSAPTGTPLGHLDMVEVFAEYDGVPRLFACVNRVGTFYVAYWVEQSRSAEGYYWVACTYGRLQAIRQGRISIRMAFLAPEDEVVLLIRATLEGEHPFNLEVLAASEVNADLLPAPNVYLSLPPPPGEAVAQQSVRLTAEESRRDTLTAALQFSSIYKHEAPSGSLGKVLVDLQAAVSARFGEKELKALNVTRDALELSAVGFYPSSFGVRLAATQLSSLFGQALIQKPIAELIEILNAAGDRSRLIELFEDNALPIKFKIRIYKLLEDLVRARAGFVLRWGSPRGQEAGVDLPLATAKLAYDVLSQKTIADRGQMVLRTRLEGASTRGTFELFDLSDREIYKGKLAPDAADETRNVLAHATLGALYQAVLRYSRTVSLVSEEEQTIYELISLEPE